MAPPDASAIDVCRCTKAKGAEENEVELGTMTMICPHCHLEEANTRQVNDTEQPAVEETQLPDEKTVFSAFQNSSGIRKIAGQHPSDQAIRKVILKRKKGCQSVKELLSEYGSAILITSLKVLMDDEVFTSDDAAKRRFPDLFPDEQLLEDEEGRKTLTELPVTTEGQPGENKCNRHEDATDSPDTVEIENSRNGQTLQERRPLTSFPVRPRQRLMSQLQLVLEHACFAFGQREMQKELESRDWTCAEAVPLQTWADLFRQDRTFETEENALRLSGTLNSMDRIQSIAVDRLNVDLVEVDELLSSAEELVQLLDRPKYQCAVGHLRRIIQDTLHTADSHVALAQKEAGRKLAQIEAQRKILKQQEEEADRCLEESLNDIRNSIEHDVFAALRRVKNALPEIG